MRVFSTARVTLTALALVSWSTAAHAQTGWITGTVTDCSRAVIPGATVTIVNADTNDTRVAISNDGGQYNVPFVRRAATPCRASCRASRGRGGRVIVLGVQFLF